MKKNGKENYGSGYNPDREKGCGFRNERLRKTIKMNSFNSNQFKLVDLLFNSYIS